VRPCLFPALSSAGARVAHPAPFPLPAHRTGRAVAGVGKRPGDPALFPPAGSFPQLAVCLTPTRGMRRPGRIRRREGISQTTQTVSLRCPAFLAIFPTHEPGLCAKLKGELQRSVFFLKHKPRQRMGSPASILAPAPINQVPDSGPEKETCTEQQRHLPVPINLRRESFGQRRKRPGADRPCFLDPSCGYGVFPL
jgi:hypothetical protein